MGNVRRRCPYQCALLVFIDASCGRVTPREHIPSRLWCIATVHGSSSNDTRFAAVPAAAMVVVVRAVRYNCRSGKASFVKELGYYRPKWVPGGVVPPSRRVWEVRRYYLLVSDEPLVSHSSFSMKASFALSKRDCGNNSPRFHFSISAAKPAGLSKKTTTAGWESTAFVHWKNAFVSACSGLFLGLAAFVFFREMTACRTIVLGGDLSSRAFVSLLTSSHLGFFLSWCNERRPSAVVPPFPSAVCLLPTSIKVARIDQGLVPPVVPCAHCSRPDLTMQYSL